MSAATPGISHATRLPLQSRACSSISVSEIAASLIIHDHLRHTVAHLHLRGHSLDLFVLRF